MAVPSKGQRMTVPPSLQCTSLQLALIASRQDEREDGTCNRPGKMIPSPSSPASRALFLSGSEQSRAPWSRCELC